MPKLPGEYVLKLYGLDATSMGAVFKDPVVNHIHVEPIDSNLVSTSSIILYASLRLNPALIDCILK